MDIELQIAEDYSMAHIIIRTEEGEKVTDLSEKELLAVLNEKGVNTGIDSEAIKQITTVPTLIKARAHKNKKILY